MFLKLRASEMKISAYAVVIGFAIISLCQITYSTDDLDDLDSDSSVDIIRTPGSAHNVGKRYHAVITFQNEDRLGNDLDGVVEGDSVKFTCTYNLENSSPQLETTYNFARNNSKKYVQQGIGNVLTLKNVTVKDTGFYRCEINDSLDVLYSEILFMKVKSKYPEQSNHTSDVEWYRKVDYQVEIDVVLQEGQRSLADYCIPIGSNLVFDCTIWGPQSTISNQSIHFLHNDTRILPDENNDFTVDVGVTRITIYRINKTAAGKYSCEFFSGEALKPSREHYNVTVCDKPPQSLEDAERYRKIQYIVDIISIQDHNTFREIVIGSNLVFECYAWGPKSTNNNQSIYFLHNDTRIIADEKNVFSLHDLTTRLLIKRINKTDSGKYSCEFFDGEELVASRHHYNLTVRQKPRCLEGPWNATLEMSDGSINTEYTFNESSNVTFTCEIAPSNTTILRRKWFHTKTELLLNPTAGVEFIDSNLLLKRITTAFDGTYTCEIEIEAGRVCSKGIWLRVAKLKEEKPQEVVGSWDEVLKSQENSKNLSKPDSAGGNEAGDDTIVVKPKLHVKLGDELKIKQIYEWDDVYLTCSVEPNTTVIHKFTWFQDGRILLSNNKLGIDSASSTLRFNRISKKSIGKYICQGQTNEDPIYSDPFLLPIVKAVTNLPCAKPSVSLRNSIRLRGEGLRDEGLVDQFSNASLICDVQVRPSPTILTRRWFRNGKKMSENKKHGIYFNGSALQFTSIEKPSQAEYMCQVETDSDIVLYSNPLNLMVVDKQYTPRNEKEKVELVVQLGYSLELDDIRESDDIYFTCLLKPKIIDYRRVVWFHQAFRIQRSKRPFIEYGNSTLILKDIRENQSGRYYCQAETNAGYLISNWVDIHVKPKSEKTRTDMSPDVANANVILMEVVNGTIPDRVIEFDDVYLICYIVSDLIPDNYTFDWSHNQTELRRKRESSNKVIILRHYRRITLIVLRIDQGFSGAFTGHVAFSDESGLHEYKTHGVEIGDVREFVTNVPPTVRATFKGTEENATIKETHAAFFTCDIKPYEMNIRRIHWIHNGTLLDTKLGEFDNFEIMKGFETLLLKRANKESAGRYQCEVETELAQIVMSNIVTISIEGSKENDTNSAVENPLVFAYLDTRPQWIFKNRKTTSVTCYVFPLQYKVEYTVSKWLLNGVILRNLPDAHQYAYGKHISFYQLHIIRITEFYTGNYTCLIRLRNGTRIEGYPAQLLKVHDKPNRQEVHSYPDRQIVVAELQNDPEDIYVNDTVYFYCVIKSDVEVTMFRWFFNLFDSNDSYNVTELEEHRIDPGNGTYFSSDNRTLILRQVQNSYTTVGYYICEAETYLGIYKSEPTPLSKIEDKPEYDRDYWSKGNVELFVETVDLELDFIHETDDIALACIIKPESTAVIEIEWRRNNETILPKEMTLHDNRTLIIRNIDRNFTGNYTCHANTKKGYLISKHLPLVVKQCISLQADVQPSSQFYYYEGDRLYIYCDIQPNTTKYRNIQWYHNGIKPKPNEYYDLFSYHRNGTVMEIEDIKKSNLGSYTCGIETFENITYRSLPGQLSQINEDKIHAYRDTGKPFTTVKLDDETDDLSNIYEGMSVWLYCQVKPKSAFIFSIEWFHNGSSFPEYEGPDSHFRYGSWRLTVLLQSVTLNSSGIYECVMDTKKGEVKPSNKPQFILQVKPKPTYPSAK